MPAHAVDPAKPDTLRIPASKAYLEGREAFARGLDYYDANPYGRDRAMDREDWHIGWADAHDGVSIEFRTEAEENGGRL